ncbi:hypothetical protein Gasu2_67250 [Galdieria sulphuraria]|nr:hypothetical protein Gasu2_67250 [Galdieria sulphuraria]
MLFLHNFHYLTTKIQYHLTEVTCRIISVKTDTIFAKTSSDTIIAYRRELGVRWREEVRKLVGSRKDWEEILKQECLNDGSLIYYSNHVIVSDMLTTQTVLV